MDAETLKQFVGTLRTVVPDLEIKYKNESLVQKLIGMLLHPFNPLYLTDYVTTFGSTIYFSTKASYDSAPDSSFAVIAHEFVHISDSKKDKLFRLKYIFPQVLVVLPILLYGLLAWSHAWILGLAIGGYVVGAYLSRFSKVAFYVTLGVSLLAMLVLGWYYTKWKLLVLLGFAFVGPWPAPWRTNYELRGYGMTVAVFQWLYGNVSAATQAIIIDHFTGPEYFYMSWTRLNVERTIEATRQQAQLGALQREFPYSVVYDFLYAHRLLQSMKA